MEKQSYVIERTFDSSVTDVWNALTKKELMKQWYFDPSDFKPEVGFEFTFSGGTLARTYYHLCRITESLPGKNWPIPGIISVLKETLSSVLNFFRKGIKQGFGLHIQVSKHFHMITWSFLQKKALVLDGRRSSENH